jgi:transposase-like protein
MASARADMANLQVGHRHMDKTGGIGMGNVIELVAREKTYSGREVAATLGIGASTLRKWSMLLEQHGYRFLRDSQNRREYRQSDVAALRSFYQMTKEQLVPLEEAACKVVTRTAPSSAPARTEAAAPLVPRSPAPFERLEEQVHALARHVQRQDEAQLALLERLEKQEAYIRSSLKERDRRLTKAMRDILETKAQIARMQDEKRKTSIWHKLFRIT